MRERITDMHKDVSIQEKELLQKIQQPLLENYDTYTLLYPSSLVIKGIKRKSNLFITYYLNKFNDSILLTIKCPEGGEEL